MRDNINPLAWLEWIKNNSKNRGIKLYEENRGLAKYGDFYLTISYALLDEETILGYGYGASKSQSISSSVAELAERFVLHAEGIGGASNSNGFAAHTSAEIAKQNAVFELFERDALLCHSITGIAFKKIELTTVDGMLPRQYFQVIAELEREGIKFSVGRMKARGIGHGIVVAMDGHDFGKRPFGIRLSTSYGLDFNTSVCKTLRNALWTLLLMLENSNRKFITLDEFMKLENPGPQDHGNYSLFPDKSGWMESMFLDDPEWAENEINNEVSIQIQSCCLPYPFEDAPLFVYQASSDDLQSLFFGPNHIQNLNLSRLNQFAGKALDSKILSISKPHFLD